MQLSNLVIQEAQEAGAVLAFLMAVMVVSVAAEGLRMLAVREEQADSVAAVEQQETLRLLEGMAG